MNIKRCILVVFIVVSACASAKSEVERFALDYVRSVYDRGDLYERFTPAENRAAVDASRDNMTRNFEAVGWDKGGPGIYEFSIKFSNGATGIVTIHEQKGEITAASLIVVPPATS